MNADQEKQLDFTKLTKCPECHSEVVSIHGGKFKCHKCNYVASFNQVTGRRVDPSTVNNRKIQHQVKQLWRKQLWRKL